MTSEVAFFCAGRPADAFKAEKPGPVRSVDEIPFFFRDKTSELAIHNPHYRQQSRVCKGGTDITFYCEVGSSQPAVHSTSVLAIHCPYYRHTCRVHKGGTESEIPSMS